MADLSLDKEALQSVIRKNVRLDSAVRINSERKIEWIARQRRSASDKAGASRSRLLTHVTEMERRLEEASALAPQLTDEQRRQLLALGDDLELLWDHPRSPVTLEKRILRTVLKEVIADTTDDPPSVHLKLH